MRYDFELKIRSLPRTTTKKEWKSISHYLRLVRRKIQLEMNKIDIPKILSSSLVYGFVIRMYT